MNSFIFIVFITIISLVLFIFLKRNSHLYSTLRKIKRRLFRVSDKQIFSASLLNQVLNKEIQDFHQSTIRFRGFKILVINFSLPEINCRVSCQIPNEFPFFPPRILISLPENPDFELPIVWKFQPNELLENQLGNLIKNSLFKQVIVLQTVNQENALIYGPFGSEVAATSDINLAMQQGWYPIYSQKRVFLDIKNKYFARSGGILSQKLCDKCVSVFGCGSGGSYLAEQLVRSGVGKLILCDQDTVEAENLCRSGYEICDLGSPKVNALSRKLRNVNPAVELKLYNKDLTELSHEELKGIIAASQVIIAGTDMPRAQEILNKYAYQLGIPAVFPGLYERASGGQIIITIPGKTPCYICSLGLRRALSEPYMSESEISKMSSQSAVDEPEVDYSTGTLKAEPGLAGDIHHLDSITLKIILGLLLQDIPDEQPCDTRDFIRGLSTQTSDGSTSTKNFVITCHAPNFWFFPEVRDDPSQDYAYHTVWAETSEYRRSDCPICGDNPEPLKPNISVNQVLTKGNPQAF